MPDTLYRELLEVKRKIQTDLSFVIEFLYNGGKVWKEEMYG